MNIIKRKIFQNLCLSVFICFCGGLLHAQDIPFPGLVTFLGEQYASPFRVVGKVKEISNERLMFEKRAVPLQKDRHLWVTEHEKGLSPQLQRQVAWIKVEAIYPKSALARVEEVVGRPIERGDWILTPPAPVIHLYTNIKAKHTFSPYHEILKALVEGGYKVREVSGDSYPEEAGAADLLLRIEAGEADHLLCQLERLKGGRVLYTKSLPGWRGIATAFPPGHVLRKAVPVPHLAGAPSLRHPGVPISQPPGTTSSTFRVAKPAEKADLYRLSEESLRVIACDLEGDGQPDLAFLQKGGVTVYSIEKGRLTEKVRYSFPEKEVFPLHLHAIDLDGDGGDELLVTLSKPAHVMDKKDNRLCSEVLSFKAGDLRAVAMGLPYYLRVIRNRQGNPVALAQREGEYQQYAGSIYLVQWNQGAKAVEIGRAYKPAANIYSIYQFNLVPGDPDRVIILEPSTVLHGYFAPEERVEASGERVYGPFREMGYPLKLEKEIPLGGFDSKKTYKEVYAPRRFELRVAFDGQSFIIYKERFGGLVQNLIKGKLSNRAQGQDQVVGVKWMGNRIVETWQSRKLAKDVLDFTFLEKPDRVLILYRDDDGYALEAFY